MRKDFLIKREFTLATAAGALDTVSGSFATGRGAPRILSPYSPGTITTVSGSQLDLQAGGRFILEQVNGLPFGYQQAGVSKGLIMGSPRERFLGESQKYQFGCENFAAASVTWNLITHYGAAIPRNDQFQIVEGLNLARWSDGTKIVTAGALQELSFVVPKNRGSVWGFRMICGSGSVANSDLAEYTVSVNGVNIIEEVGGGYFWPEFGVSPIYELDIDPGSTVVVTADATKALLDVTHSFELLFNG